MNRKTFAACAGLIASCLSPCLCAARAEHGPALGNSEPRPGDVAVVMAAGQLDYGPPERELAQADTQPSSAEGLPATDTPAQHPAQHPAQISVVSSDPNPAAAGTNTPSWLAPPRGTPNTATSGVGWTPWILLLTLSAVGGALFLQRNKVRQRVKRQYGKAEIHVLASNRIGPKAHAVAIEFGGSVYLLGVTDDSVRRLDTLTKEQVQASIAEASEGSGQEDERAGLDLPPPAEADDEEDDEPRGRPEGRLPRRGQAPFKAYLDQSVKRAEGGVSPAEQLAQNLSDRTSLKGRGRPELVDIEGQAAGLAARLNNTVTGPKRNR